MGWIGDHSRVLDALRAAKAARDEDGKFILRGGSVCSFMGAGQEACVEDGVEYLTKDREWRPLVAILSGGLRVRVI